MQNLNGSIAGGNITLGKAGLTGLSGAASTITTSVTGGATSLTYMNQGRQYNKANLAGVATPVNDASTSLAVLGTAASGAAFRPLVAQQPPVGRTTIYPGSVACFVFGFDTAGNLRVAQGEVVPYTDTSAGSTIVPMPQIPDWMTPFGYAVIKLVSATAASWTFGTSLWNATGVTIDTPVDVGVMPAVAIVTA